MRAAVCHGLSADRSGLAVEAGWSDAPAPGAGEVTVGMTCAALNYPDLLMLSGGYQHKPDLPFVPGVEGCGVIDAVGEDVAADLIGARVIVGARSGCLAERLTVPLAGVRMAPDALHDAQAAALTVGALTAYVALVRRGRLRAGERVLVAGAGGGMGLAAVQMAKALDAVVVAAASSAEKLAVATAAGADETLLVDRATQDYSSLSEPVDVVYDPIGSLALLRTLRWGGRYLVVGFVGGVPVVPLNRLLLKGIEVVGVRAGEYARQDPAGGLENLHAIDALAAAGRLTPHIGLELPLARVGEAFAAMAAGSIVGKAVIDLRAPLR